MSEPEDALTEARLILLGETIKERQRAEVELAEAWHSAQLLRLKARHLEEDARFARASLAIRFPEHH